MNLLGHERIYYYRLKHQKTALEREKEDAGLKK